MACSMQQAAMVACIIVKFLHATEQHTACCPEWRHSVRIIAYTFRGCMLLSYFLIKMVFGYSPPVL